jgi:tRNA pseudouridine55 synthase
MGRDLGCFGHISELRRTRVDPFESDDMVTLTALEAAAPAAPQDEEGAEPPVPAFDRFRAIDALLLDTGAALDCLPRVVLTDDAAVKVRLGNPAIVRGRDAPLEADEACAVAKGRLVAIGSIEAGMFHPRRVFAG